jgi:hypothetical protein
MTDAPIITCETCGRRFARPYAYGAVPKYCKQACKTEANIRRRIQRAVDAAVAEITQATQK